MSLKNNAEANETRRKELKNLEEMKAGIEQLNRKVAGIEQLTAPLIVRARLIPGLMAITTILLGAILLVLIWFTRTSPTGSPGPHVVQIVSMPGVASMATCWKTRTLAFEQGESEKCEAHSLDDCHWTADLSPDPGSGTDATGAGTLGDYIDSIPPGNTIQILVYGSHDATPLKRGRHDSNFDLAFKRASAVIRDLRSSQALAGRESETIYIPLAGSTPPSPCASDSGESDNWDRRQPRIVVFSSGVQQR